MTREPSKEFDVGSAEAKKDYWLRPEDLRALPRETVYYGFAQGRASWYYCAADLRAAAIAKHGQDGYDKKVNARAKRLENKAKKRAAPGGGDSDVAAAKAKKQKTQAAAKDYSNINNGLLRNWALTLTKPERVVGTTGSLEMRGDDDGEINVDDNTAYTFGNLHGLASGSSWSDKTVKIDTKWKVCGKRWSGKLYLTMGRDGASLRGKYNSGVSKSAGGIKVIEFTGK